MSEILNFACPAINCGRKFATKIKLDDHIKLRHPQNKEKNEIKENNIINQSKDEKNKIQDKNTTNKNKITNKIQNDSKKNINQAKNIKSNINNNKIKIGNKINNTNLKKEENNKDSVIKKEKDEIKKIDSSINIKDKTESNNNKIRNKKEQSEKIKKLQQQKDQIILDDLYSKIKSLENHFEQENLEFQKQFELPDMPIIENEILDSEKTELNEHQDDEINNIDNKKEETIKEVEEENIKNDEKESASDTKIKTEENSNIINEKKDISQKNYYYDQNKIITIEEDFLIQNSDSKENDLEDISSLDLSKKNIASFMTKRNVDFSEIQNLKILNISSNWMTYSYDIRLFINLEQIYINDNKIPDISFCEFLPNLIILNCENNEITLITSLKKCSKLKILKLSQNKIQYLNSTLSTFKSLNLLEELTIKENPFLNEIFAYNKFFLFEYQNLLKFDEEDINDIDRDIASRFVRQNISMYHNIQSIKNNTEINNDISSKDKTTFRVGNTIITKEMVVPYKGKAKILEKNKNKKNGANMRSMENSEENEKNKELKNIIKEQKKEIENIKLELENINQLNKEYEIIIQDYKIKIEENQKNKNINTNNNINEKNKLLKELDMWKKEYLDLFNKLNKSSLFPMPITSNNNQNSKFSKIMREQNDINNNINLYKSMPNSEIKKHIERPQTAQVRHTNAKNFEELCEGIKIMYSKNRLMDVLEEESDEEEEEIDNKNKNTIKNEIKEENIKEENEDEIDYDGNDIIPDDDIDEMFRKSCADLQKMREDIKFMNEAMDKKESMNINNIDNKGGKIKLNPVIVKKENNPNFLGNKALFGNINQKNTK